MLSVMPPDATATKQRLFDAAYREFAQHGLAGARVDRMAEIAQANKRMIYVHFGNKAELFDLVVARSMADLADAVPFAAGDLSRYAGELFDYLVARPEVLRLTGWAQLERPEPTTAETDTYRPKFDAIAEAQQTGAVTVSGDPADVLALVLGLVTAWAQASPALRTLAPEAAWGPERVREHRAAMVAAVRALVDPDPS